MLHNWLMGLFSEVGTSYLLLHYQPSWHRQNMKFRCQLDLQEVWDHPIAEPHQLHTEGEDRYPSAGWAHVPCCLLPKVKANVGGCLFEEE